MNQPLRCRFIQNVKVSSSALDPIQGHPGVMNLCVLVDPKLESRVFAAVLRWCQASRGLLPECSAASFSTKVATIASKLSIMLLCLSRATLSTGLASLPVASFSA